ncbi:MAG: sugar phosphate isomerase/epimerase [Clostridia bacterium]|nr:sugar phosphate isomerase/epimerase [Clostridia bacterium]
MNWRIGLNAGAYKGQPLIESVPIIKANGFDAVFTGYKTKEYAVELANHFSAAGLAYESIHAPFKGINNIWLEGEEGDAMLATLLDCMEGCEAAGVPIMVVHLSSGENPPPITDLGRARFDTLIETAGKKNITLAFENQRKVANIAYVFDYYPDAPQVRFCWDCGHESCFTPGRRYMPLFGKKLVCTHIHDNIGHPTERSPDIHVLPFDGNIDYKRVAEDIAASPYRGTLMMEVTTKHTDMYENYTAEEWYARAAAAIRRLADLCNEALGE